MSRRRSRESIERWNRVSDIQRVCILAYDSLDKRRHYAEPVNDFLFSFQRQESLMMDHIVRDEVLDQPIVIRLGEYVHDEWDDWGLGW